MALPDAEYLALLILRPALDVPVFNERPPDAKERVPFVLVERLAGTSSPVAVDALDQPLMNIEAWANSRKEARDLGEAARVALWAARGTSIDSVGDLVNVRDVTAPVIIADPGEASTIRRAVHTMFLFTHDRRS